MQEKNFVVLTKPITQVQDVAQEILKLTKQHNLEFVLLEGNIGSGKTTLVKALALVLGEKEAILSPTFNKMLVYKDFVHIDAYNMQGQTLEHYWDYFEERLVIIEWAENLLETFETYLKVKITFKNEELRKYQISWKEK